MRFQTRQILFPEHAFFAFIWLKIDEERDVNYPFLLSQLFYSEIDAINRCKKLINNNKLKDSTLRDYIMLAKAKFNESIPLKKEYWTQAGSVPKYTEFKNTFMRILKAFDKIPSYKVMVVPQGITKHKPERLTPVFTFKSAKDPEIIKFMKGSGAYVDPSAKNAALYEVADMYGYNISTGQKIKDGLGYWEN